MLRRRRVVFALALAAGVAVCAASSAQPRAASGRRAMNQTPGISSMSLVLRASHIVVVTIVSADAREWARSSPGLKARSVALTVQVREVLRGALDPMDNQPVRFAVTQYDYAGMLRMQPLPGPWSSLNLVPGASFAVFAQTSGSDAAHVFAEPATLRVVPAEMVITGLRIAARAETQQLPLAETLALAAPQAARLDPIFAEFLWAKYAGVVLASQEEFDRLADFVDAKGFDVPTRNALVQAGYDLVSQHGDEVPLRGRRIALSMLRVLLMPEAEDLHENLIETYLPNILGLTSDLPRQTALAVLNGRQAERAALDAFLRRHGTDADATELERWLRAK